MSSISKAALAPLLASLASHLIFKRYEPTGIPLLAALLIAVPGILVFIPNTEEPRSSLEKLLLSFSLYYGGLLLSITTYRISPAHSLAKYPGPLACKISKLWLVYISSQGRLNLYIRELHEKYGNIVRVGPNELSVIDIALIPSIMGAKGMPKGPMWDGRRVLSSKGSASGYLVSSRDLKAHAAARQAWNTAFTTTAIKGYEPILLRRVTQLVETLRAQSKQLKPVDLSRLLSFFSFDVMGDVVFGGGFELVRNGDEAGLWRTLAKGLYLPSLTQHIPWCTVFFPYFPSVGQDMRTLAKFAIEQATRRLKEGSVNNDLFYYLEKAHTADGPYPFPLAITNSVIAIIGGADTSASVLSNVFFYLSTHPESYTRLQAEVDQAFPRGTEPTEAAILANMVYLNAVINETLRMQPAVPTTLQRAPAVGGGSKMIGDGMIIPEGTSVLIPPYTIQRDPRYFSPNPDRFWPERWILKDKGSDFRLNQNAFIAFSTGPANCVGKHLAMLEMRLVITHIMQTFDIRLAEGYDPSQWAKELKDYFVLHKGSLPVVLVDRSSK